MYRVSLDRRVITFASALELVLAVVAGSILVIFIGDQFKSIASLIWVVFALVVGCVVIQPKILHGILRLIKVESLQPIQLRHSVEWTLYYIVIWITGGIAQYFLIGTIVNLDIGLIAPIIGAWVISGLAGTLVTILPLGLGIREITLAVLLTPILPAGMAPITSILSRVIFTIFDLSIAGLTFLIIPVSSIIVQKENK